MARGLSSRGKRWLDALQCLSHLSILHVMDRLRLISSTNALTVRQSGVKISVLRLINKLNG